MKKIALLALAFTLSKSIVAQTNSINDHAKQLLEVTGSGKLGIQVLHTMIASFKRDSPNIPDEFWDEVSKEVSSTELIDLLVPIYVKYYTDAELLKLIEFYKSPLGQKVVEKLPFITQDSFTAGQEWGRRLGERIAKRIKEKGYKL